MCTNRTVASLYLEKETAFMKVFDTAVESQMDRRCTFVSLGGGVTGDVWVCSCCIPWYDTDRLKTLPNEYTAEVVEYMLIRDVEAEARRAIKRTIEKNIKIKKTIDRALSPRVSASFTKKKGESIWMDYGPSVIVAARWIKLPDIKLYTRLKLSTHHEFASPVQMHGLIG
ncbi:hypothetical protein EJB05_29390, partial [Eragrostis curvula]